MNIKISRKIMSIFFLLICYFTNVHFNYCQWLYILNKKDGKELAIDACEIYIST